MQYSRRIHQIRAMLLGRQSPARIAEWFGISEDDIYKEDDIDKREPAEQAGGQVYREKSSNAN